MRSTSRERGRATKKGHEHKHRPAGSKIKKRYMTVEQWQNYKYKWDFFWRFNKFPKEEL